MTARPPESRIFTADTPKGPIFAGACPSSREEPRVEDRPLGAYLRPFSSDEAARAALEASGGVNVRRAGK